MRTAVFLMIIFFASQSSGLDLKDYESLKDRDSEVFKIYMKGVGEGYSWANSELALRKQSPLYCEPSNLALGVDNYLDILQRKIKKDYDTFRALNSPVELILLKGLMETFPCK